MLGDEHRENLGLWWPSNAFRGHIPSLSALTAQHEGTASSEETKEKFYFACNNHLLKNKKKYEREREREFPGRKTFLLLKWPMNRTNTEGLFQPHSSALKPHKPSLPSNHILLQTLAENSL